ncbi:MAG: acetylxylan esterase [Bifidobacteriaceae bacterium]|jgi:cephalosporin-C deacetylase|nr:acetylxylan esterase [Bifidobacteriaceae bacterium]
MLQISSLSDMRQYQGGVDLPDDFWSFWQDTLASSRAATWQPQLVPVATRLRTVDVYDVTFAGFAGEPIKAWLRLPHGAVEPLPAIVSYAGYGGGRGLACENLLWSSAGYAHFQMDSRGQGSNWAPGETPDSGPTGPAVPGVCTRGVTSRETYYYRRLFTDAVLAVDAARQLPQVDPDRVGVTGGSQGGAMTLASACLAEGVTAAWAGVPFLADIRHAAELTDARPFSEFTDYLACHRDQVEDVFKVLAYFDGVNFARGGRVPAGISVALMDVTVPPPTVFAAYNNYAGPKELVIWEFNGHESGAGFEDVKALDFFARHLGA